MSIQSFNHEQYLIQEMKNSELNTNIKIYKFDNNHVAIVTKLSNVYFHIQHYKSEKPGLKEVFQSLSTEYNLSVDNYQLISILENISKRTD